MVTDPEAPEATRNRRIVVPVLVGGLVLLALASAAGISDNPPGIPAMLAWQFCLAQAAVRAVARPGVRKPETRD